MTGSQQIADMTREGDQPGVRKQQPLADVAMGWMAEEKEKEAVAVLKARAAYDVHPPPLPPLLAMGMLSKEEMAVALRRSKEDAADAAWHQRLVEDIEKGGAKQQVSAMVSASQVVAASIREGASASAVTPGSKTALRRQHQAAK